MDKTAKIVFIVIAIVLIATGFWYEAGYNKNRQVVQKELIKIGAILPLTGEGASYGESFKRGIELGVSEIEKKYGKKITVVYEDSRMVPADAATAAQKLISSDKVKAILIGSSRETLAVAPIAEQNKTLLMTAGSAPEITQIGDYVFRTCPSDFYQGNDLADLAIKKGYNKPAILFMGDNYGKGISDVFTKRIQEKGGTIAAMENFTAQGTGDFKAPLTKIKEARPNVILIIADINQYPLILKQMNELNINLPILASECLKAQEVLINAGSLAEGVLFTYYTEPKTKEYEIFNSLYKEWFGAESGPFAAEFFDNTELLLSALIESRSDVEKAKFWLYAVKDWKGATGTTNFDANGDVTDKSYTIYTVKNGQFVPYGD
ncbi:MAG: penicillin-binding protein activator [Patescibacteria group bacterium]|nr:penicillin-binding protein activator [Patescibacteria group bacterium]